jgi:hypothetical protein
MFDALGAFPLPTHSKLTEESLDSALKTMGEDSGVSATCRNTMLRGLINGNHEQDILHLATNARHYNRDVVANDDDTYKKESDKAYGDYVASESAAFLGNFKQSKLTDPFTKEQCDATLRNIGLLTHSWQDFFAHAIGRNGSWDIWSKDGKGDPEQRDSVWPSSYNIGGGGEHPATEEPILELSPEYAARYKAASAYVAKQLGSMIPLWYSKCRCHCK